MNELLDEDLIKKNIAKLWWKEKWRLYNAILIPIGLVLLFFEYHHYIDISSRDFGVYYDKGIIIKYSVSFAV
ncbi:MAG TPA: hypothetical protein PK546_11910, partial [Chitinophagales bacterium]|nr:hypothetical protein [Chitinophagales bacterium]